MTPYQVADQEFPVVGADPLGWSLTSDVYAKTKELGPVAHATPVKSSKKVSRVIGLPSNKFLDPQLQTVLFSE